MWVNSHLLVSRCKKSSVTKTGEGWEQAIISWESQPLSCWHIQTATCPSPSPLPVVPQDMSILLVMLSPPSFSPSFLPATSTHLGTFIRFSFVKPSSAWIALFLEPLSQSCLHFSNMFTWTGCCCCFSHHPLPFTLTRCKKRAPNVWGTDEQRFHHWVTQHSPQSNSTQTSVSGTFPRNIPCWAGQERNQHYSCSSFLEIAILVQSILLASAHQPFLPPAPVISNVVAGIWGLL